jgi:hypothetical protein
VTVYITRAVSYLLLRELGNSGPPMFGFFIGGSIDRYYLSDNISKSNFRCSRQRHSTAIDVYSMFDHESKYSKQASKLSYRRHYHASFEVCSRPR